MKQPNKLIGVLFLISALCIAAVAVIEDFSYVPPEPMFETAVTEENAIDPNSASAEELQSIDGIGQALSARIIDFRTTERRFETVDDLRLVRGIGDKLFARIKSKLVIK